MYLLLVTCSAQNLRCWEPGRCITPRQAVDQPQGDTGQGKHDEQPGQVNVEKRWAMISVARSRRISSMARVGAMDKAGPHHLWGLPVRMRCRYRTLPARSTRRLTVLTWLFLNLTMALLKAFGLLSRCRFLCRIIDVHDERLS